MACQQLNIESRQASVQVYKTNGTPRFRQQKFGTWTQEGSACYVGKLPTKAARCQRCSIEQSDTSSELRQQKFGTSTQGGDACYATDLPFRAAGRERPRTHHHLKIAQNLKFRFFFNLWLLFLHGLAGSAIKYPPPDN
jgi:hypothetical protein